MPEPVCAGREEQEWAHQVSPGESEVVMLPVEATRLYLDLRPFMNIAPLAVRYPPYSAAAAGYCCCYSVATAAVAARRNTKHVTTQKHRSWNNKNEEKP